MYLMNTMTSAYEAAKQLNFSFLHCRLFLSTAVQAWCVLKSTCLISDSAHVRVKCILCKEAEMVEISAQMCSLYYQTIGLQDKPQSNSKV